MPIQDDTDIIPRKSLKMIKLKKEEEKMNDELEEDYHGGSSLSIPFMWESQPGTPKVKFHNQKPSSLLSPLTPPPSYFSRSKPLTKSSKTNFLNTIFRKRSLVPSSPALSTSSSSSSSTSSSSPSDTTKERSPRERVRRLSFDSRVDEEDEEEEEEEINNIESPVSTLRFRCIGDNEGPISCYPKLIKVFMRDSK